MKKFFCAAIAALIAALTFAAVPAGAMSTTNDAILKYTPVIDGKLDAAYLESYYSTHDFDGERNSSNFWGNGKFAFTDESMSATAYGFDCKANVYFLWDDNNLYIAVRVVDDDYGVIDDAHYADSCADTGSVGSWLQDGCLVYLSYKGMTFHILAAREDTFRYSERQTTTSLYGVTCTAGLSMKRMPRTVISAPLRPPTDISSRCRSPFQPTIEARF